MLEALLGGGSNALVGVDISSSSVKVLELSRKGERYHVEAYACEPLPANAVAEKQINDPQVVGDVIARAVDRAGVRTKNAAVAVPGAAAITKVITMPAGLSDADMEEQIRAEAEAYIPYPIEEVNLDFQVIGANERDPNSVEVLLAACRKEQIEQRLAALEFAQLKGRVIDVETYALENACQFLRHQMPDGGENRTVAVVDMGATLTSVTILHDLKTIYTREQPFGGKQLTEDIMRHYGMSFEEATKAKKVGNLPENYEGEVLAHFLADMAQQIDRSLQFFFSASTQYAQIDELVLAGGCAHIPNVEHIIQDRLKIPAQVARPFAEMSIASRAKPAQLAKEEASLLIAIGLAYRAFDDPRV